MFKKMFKRGLQVCLVMMLVFAFTMFPIRGDLPQVEANSPYFQHVETFRHTEPDEPYGRVALRVHVYKLMLDGCSHYNRYAYEVRFQKIPGRARYNNRWVTDHSWATHRLLFAGDVRWLDDYDPTTTSGVSHAYVSFTAGGKGGTATIGWKYSIPDVVVIDESDLSEHRARWEHCINEEAVVAYNTYLVRPGFLVTTREGVGTRVHGWYTVQWEDSLYFWRHRQTSVPVLSFCVGEPPPLVVRIAGSCTVKKIVEASEIPFEALWTGTDLQVAGGGSAHGISELLADRIDIGMSCREPTSEEAAKLNVYEIARDAVCIIVRDSTAMGFIGDITRNQLRFIYERGAAITTTTWHDVDMVDGIDDWTNDDHVVVPRARIIGSGTRDTFHDLVGICDDLEKITIAATGLPRLPGNQGVVEGIKANDFHIGYVALGFIGVPGLKTLRVEGTMPSVATVMDGTYPLPRSLYLMTLK